MIMIEATAHAKYVRVAPRKLRKMAEQLKGKNVIEATSMLRLLPSKGALYLLKTISSAAANIKEAQKPDTVNEEELLVSSIRIDQGPTFRRWKPRAMGRVAIIRKRTSHIAVSIRKS